MLAAVLLVLVAASIATNRLPGRWYVLICVLATGILLVLARLDGLDAADLGLGPGTVLPGLMWALVLVLAVALLYLGGVTLPKTRGLFADRRFMAAGGQHIASYLLVRIPFGTVLLEETAFRSVLFAMVTVRYGTGWAIVVTSVLFGLWHILPAVPMHDSHEAVQRASWDRYARALGRRVGDGGKHCGQGTRLRPASSMDGQRSAADRLALGAERPGGRRRVVARPHHPRWGWPRTTGFTVGRCGRGSVESRGMWRWTYCSAQQAGARRRSKVGRQNRSARCGSDLR